MFERDKDELRELGIPLATAVIDALFDDELGYRIDKREYALPEIAFEPDEVAALALAGRAWSRASLAGSAAAALRKLRSAGVEIDDSSLVGIEPVVRTTEDAFEPIRKAVVARQAVTFGYRKSDGDSSRRALQPWALTQWHGRWYVTGLDVDRGAERVFRLSRIGSPVVTTGRPGAFDAPLDHEPRVLVEQSQSSGAPGRAVLHVRAGAGNTLRRRAEDVEGGPGGWSVVGLDFEDLDRLADEVSGFGPDVVALEPEELRHAVVRRLTGAVTRHTGTEAAS